MRHSSPIIAAWQDGENAIVLACPSSQGGNYLVRAEVAGSAKQPFLQITHSCPAANHNQLCWHVEAAKELFMEWRWWEKEALATLPVRLKAETVILGTGWTQILVPGSEGYTLEQHIA
ncbi:MAG: hypothetical protein ACYCX4_00470 [Bacillota bacterium]